MTNSKLLQVPNFSYMLHKTVTHFLSRNDNPTMTGMTRNKKSMFFNDDLLTMPKKVNSCVVIFSNLFFYSWSRNNLKQLTTTSVMQ